MDDINLMPWIMGHFFPNKKGDFAAPTSTVVLYLPAWFTQERLMFYRLNEQDCSNKLHLLVFFDATTYIVIVCYSYIIIIFVYIYSSLA